MRGIELNERAAALAELVLWIGFLQWHICTHGRNSVAVPVVHNYGNIECRDAVLAWDAQELAYDDAGQLQLLGRPHFRGTHPVTGEQVSDEAAQVPQWRYVGRKAGAAAGGFHCGEPAVHWKQRCAKRWAMAMCRPLRGAWPEISGKRRLCDVWWHHAAAQVAVGHAPHGADYHQQPDDGFQPPRGAGGARQRLPSTHGDPRPPRGWTAPMAPLCASP
ncbi:MAG: hypothetical protein R3E55_17305 [Burkholderiaceae bacterium]